MVTDAAIDFIFAVGIEMEQIKNNNHNKKKRVKLEIVGKNFNM